MSQQEACRMNRSICPRCMGSHFTLLYEAAGRIEVNAGRIETIGVGGFTGSNAVAMECHDCGHFFSIHNLDDRQVVGKSESRTGVLLAALEAQGIEPTWEVGIDIHPREGARHG